MKKIYDKKEIYCRKLGHNITFQYCRKEQNQLPCSKIMDCWFEKIPIQDYINKTYKPDEIQHIFRPAPEKISTLVDLIEKAKKLTP